MSKDKDKLDEALSKFDEPLQGVLRRTVDKVLNDGERAAEAFLKSVEREIADCDYEDGVYVVISRASTDKELPTRWTAVLVMRLYAEIVELRKGRAMA